MKKVIWLFLFLCVGCGEEKQEIWQLIEVDLHIHDASDLQGGQ